VTFSGHAGHRQANTTNTYTSVHRIRNLPYTNARFGAMKVGRVCIKDV